MTRNSVIILSVMSVAVIIVAYNINKTKNINTSTRISGSDIMDNAVQSSSDQLFSTPSGRLTNVRPPITGSRFVKWVGAGDCYTPFGSNTCTECVGKSTWWSPCAYETYSGRCLCGVGANVLNFIS